MNLMKKAVSAVTSAALLASLLATAVAPAAFGASTSSGGGTIYPDSAASAAGSITFAEDAVDQFGNGSFTVAVTDSAGGANINFATSTAPTVTRNAGVGSASAGFVGNTLVVNVSGTDDTKIDSWTISGLKVSAQADAAFGAVLFPVTADTVGLAESLYTVTGVTDSAIVAGATLSFDYVLDAPAVGADFQVTGTVCTNTDGNLEAGKVTVAASGVALEETFSAVATTGGGVITKATVLVAGKPIGTAVSQAVCVTQFPSFATVGDAVEVYNHDATSTFQAGVNNQDDGDVHTGLGFFDELLLSGDSVTWTIATAGVTFSPNSCVVDCMDSNIGLGTPTLGADRKSITVKITEDAMSNDWIDFYPNYDVALGVANGTVVDLGVTVSRAGVVVLGSPVTIAVVGFVTAGSTAAPTVYIGQNDQSTGMVTLKESAAGSISDGSNLEVCLQTDESWAVGRYFWAVVTSGDLKFNVAGLPASQAKMTIDGDCLDVLPYTASGTASTIEIRDGTSTAPAASAPTAGPKVNVPNWMVPGQVYVRVYNGGQIADNIVIAVRAYTGTPTASTSGQLPVLRGILNQATGSVTFTEGAPNQFGSSYWLDLCLVYPSVSDNGAFIWSNPVGVNAPVVTTNSTVSGLIATFDASESGDECLSLFVTDTGLSGLGTITVSNLKLDVKVDAPLGPLFVRIYTSQDQLAQGKLQATVSPASVIVAKALSIKANSALGSNPTSGYTTKTPKTQVVGKSVTWKFTGGTALAGKRVNVMVATKIGGAWGGPVYLKSAWADANGIVTVVLKYNAAKWINVRVQWPGSATYSVSTSPALGALWK